MQSQKVTIYSTPTCHFCHAAKELFKEHDIAFTEKDVANNMENRNEMVEKSHQMGVPVIFVDDEMVVGFDENKLRQLLNIA